LYLKAANHLKERSIMKNFFAILAIAALAFTISCSKASPVNEGKAIMNSMIKLTDSTSDKLENAGTAKDAAAALVTYVAEMKILGERGKEFAKNHPGVSYLEDESNKAENEALNKVMYRFSAASMKASVKFSGSKEFADAASKMQDIMK